MRYEQRGYNSRFPVIIKDTWKIGELVPEWLSDRAKINYIDDNTGNVGLDLVETNNGGYIIRDSSGSSDLVHLISRDDLVCCDIMNNIFSLTKKQIELLYDPKPTAKS